MAKKWTNRNVAGVLHYLTGNVERRRSIFQQDYNCIAFLEEMQALRHKRESRLICFVVVWQESFKTLRLWSNWLIWQKINYIHNNPLRAGLVDSARDYRWSSFRSFYHLEDEELLSVDNEWLYPEDPERLKDLQRRSELY